MVYFETHCSGDKETGAKARATTLMKGYIEAAWAFWKKALSRLIANSLIPISVLHCAFVIIEVCIEVCMGYSK
jgi:hypothetical protein